MRLKGASRESLNCRIHYMWYRMPIGRDAVSEAKVTAVRSRMAAIRCAASLLARIGTRELDRALGNAICQQLEQVQEALEGREEPSPLSPLPSPHYTDSGNTPVRSC